jgi:hypothetical protein
MAYECAKKGSIRAVEVGGETSKVALVGRWLLRKPHVHTAGGGVCRGGFGHAADEAGGRARDWVARGRCSRGGLMSGHDQLSGCGVGRESR